MSNNNDLLPRGGSGGMSRGLSASLSALLDSNNMGHSEWGGVEFARWGRRGACSVAWDVKCERGVTCSAFVAAVCGARAAVTTGPACLCRSYCGCPCAAGGAGARPCEFCLLSLPQKELLLFVAAPAAAVTGAPAPSPSSRLTPPRDPEPGTSTGEGGGSQRGGGDSSGLPRSGSVAPFVPQRANLTPAEEKAHFIMLPTTSPAADGDGGGGGGGSSKQLTVFSEKGMLLGFYEEVSLGGGGRSKEFEM